jgi:chromosome segregation protein
MIRVTRLEVFGFKSFCERTVLPLENGITGIVGPNGCGKSNVVDALRWVLGETRASQLRGGVQEDVIFNGSEKLRPLGLAEVTLTMRNDVNATFQSSILKIVPEEPAVSDLIDSENEENFDERFSLPEYSRFQWVNSASEIQITRRLHRSGEAEFFINKVPSRLRDIKELCRFLGLSARSYTIVAQGEVSRIVTSKPVERRLILEEAAGVAGFRDKTVEAERRLKESKHNLTRLEDVIRELDRQVSLLKRQVQRAEKKALLLTELNVLEDKLFIDSYHLFNQRESKFVNQQQGVEEQLADLSLQSNNQENDLDNLKTTVKEWENLIDQVQVELEELRAVISKREREKSRLSGAVRETETRREVNLREQDRIINQLELMQKKLSEVLLEVQSFSTEENRLTDQLAELEKWNDDEQLQLGEKQKIHRKELTLKERKVSEIRDKYIAAKSRLQAIQDQILACTPLLRDAFSLGLVKHDEPQLELLIDNIEAPPHLAIPLQAILGEKAQFLVTANPLNLGERFIVYLNELPEQKRKGKGIGVYRSSIEADSFKDINDSQIPFPSLISQLNVPKSKEKLLNSLINNVYITTTAFEAISFFQSLDANSNIKNITLVTMEGDIIQYDCFYSSRSRGGIVDLKLKERTFLEDYELLLKEHELSRNELENDRIELKQLEDRLESVLAENRKRHNEIRDLSRLVATAKGQRLGAERLKEQLTRDLERLTLESSGRNELVTKLELEYNNAVEALATYNLEIPENSDEKIRDLNGKLVSLRKERDNARLELQKREQQEKRSRRQHDELIEQKNQLELSLQRVILERENLKNRILEEYNEECLQTLLSNAESTEVEILSKEDRYREVQNLHEIKNQLKKIGEVDSTVMAQYQEENQRLNELQIQRDDLLRGVQAIENSLQRLVDAAEAKFLATFSAVKENFKQLAPELFGGGDADLALSDPLKPLDSGIEITIRPPGKRPKGIDLLSGGEKALCATALILSMFKERPSPLCVLDEVDAPLDDANLVRFLNAIAGMTSSTQFLMITHNKVSMARSNTLIGVTMPQPGASKLITVSLQESEIDRKNIDDIAV